MIIYDCEIKKMILGRNETRDPLLQYCAGWHDYTGMGISVVCAFDTDTELMHTLQVCDNDDHASTLQNLINRTDYVIGFNNHSFDNNLVAAFGITVPIDKSYDIYEQILYAAGWVKGTWKPAGYKLDLIARANGVADKNEASGALAPKLYQQGELERLYLYCENDVRMTVQLLHEILNGRLVCPNTNRVLDVKTPKDVLGTVQAGLF